MDLSPSSIRSILWAVIRSHGTNLGQERGLGKEPGSSAGSREEILRKLRERIVGFAASGMQRDAAEDLAQEVLILLHEKYDHLDRLEDLVPLSLKIVRFKMLAYRRKARRHGEYTQVSVDEVQTPDGAGRADCPGATGDSRTAPGGHCSLGERCRKLLAIKLEGKSFADIQKSFGVSSSTPFTPGTFAAASS